MSIAQITENPYNIRMAGKAGTRPAGIKAVGKTRAGGIMSVVMSAAVNILERSDTLAEKAISYGICGFALVYMSAQMIRFLF